MCTSRAVLRLVVLDYAQTWLPFRDYFNALKKVDVSISPLRDLVTNLTFPITVSYVTVVEHSCQLLRVWVRPSADYGLMCANINIRTLWTSMAFPKGRGWNVQQNIQLHNMQSLCTCMLVPILVWPYGLAVSWICLSGLCCSIHRCFCMKLFVFPTTQSVLWLNHLQLQQLPIWQVV